MSTPQPRVVAVVLAWNQVELTLECLDSLQRTQYPDFTILLADNGSTDGTAGIVAERFPKVDILRIDENKGLQRGYNLGIRRAIEMGADYVLPMNNDTIADPGMLAALVEAAQSHPHAGLLSPKIYHYHGDRNRLWCAGARWVSFPPRIKLVGADQPDDPAFAAIQPMQYLTSCCLLIPRPALEKAGLFDEAYYFYYDDWDLSERYRAAGYELLFVPGAKLWHRVSASTLKGDQPGRWWYSMGRGSVRFYLKYRSPAVLAGYAAWFVLREAFKLKFSRIPPFLAGLASGLSGGTGGES